MSDMFILMISGVLSTYVVLEAFQTLLAHIHMPVILLTKFLASLFQIPHLLQYMRTI
jgi:hypothetical protein